MSEQKEPWWNRPMTRMEITFMGFLTIAALIAIFTFAHISGSKMEARHEAERQACNNLDVKFGQSVKVKEGFYRDVDFVAIWKGTETIGVQYLKGAETEKLRFNCSDVEIK